MALSVLNGVERGLRLDVALRGAPRGMSRRDRAWVHELVYGVSRLRGRLDHLIGRRVHGGIGRLDPAVLGLLRLGAYQVLYMDSVPRYAAVSQTVSLARQTVGRGPGGLVNAVLRGVGEDGDGPERFPRAEDDPLGYLSTWGSHPRWLVARWLERWSVEKVSALVEANNRPPALYLVPLDRSPRQAAVDLTAAGVGAEPVGGGTDCLRLSAGTHPVEALAVLPSIIQDPGANLVVQFLGAAQGMKVADLCAAPGGKALALSRRVSYILAADRSEVRMHMLRDNVKRTGGAVGAVVADARRPPVEAVDMVLLDVPCTGTGTLRRHPDGRWRLSPESVVTLARVQEDLLEAAAELVAPGGLLVYSTCTLEPEENEEQLESFLGRHPEFTIEPFADGGAELAARIDGRGHLVILPQDTGFDGAFAGRMRRCA
ncbi:MAG: transcription antitermination factor NusB [Gemmatimonadota bacterium]